MKILCKKGANILFTNRETSYFGEHSFEIILPYTINFEYKNKSKMKLCGYTHYFEYLDTIPKPIMKYIRKLNKIIDTKCYYDYICNINTEFLKEIIPSKPVLPISNLIQLMKVERDADLFFDDIDCIDVEIILK
jgi:hypothetical protein